jgi:hypothetical protein
MNYKEKYLQQFSLEKTDFVYCEYSWIVKRVMVKADNIHHIFFGANKTNDLNNLMAVSYEVHQLAHNEKLDRHHLKEVHLTFLKNSPYE